jgi:aspartate aminotransferase/aminotransferase
VSYPEQIKLCGGVPIGIPYDKTVFEYEDYITNRTRMIVINNPNNPRGNILNLDELSYLYHLAEKYDLFILSDEAYSDFVSNEDTFISMGNLDKDMKRSIIVNSISKNFGISGWRIGYAIANKAIITQLLTLNQHLVTCAPTILQQYVSLYFDDILAHTFPQMKALIEKRSEIKTYMDQIGLEYLSGNATFYFFVSLGKSSLSSDEFCMRLLNEQKICAVPGIGYGESCDAFIRVSVGTETMEKTKMALQKIKDFITDTEVK